MTQLTQATNNEGKSRIQRYQELVLSEDKAIKILNKAQEIAEDVSRANGAPINEKGELEYNNKGEMIGYSQYGIHLRDALIELMPDELVALTVGLRPEHHMGKWNHPYTVMECFWGAYVALKTPSVEEMRAQEGK